MRILFIIPSLAGGGAEKLVNDLLPMLKEQGIICELLIFTEKNSKYLNSVSKNGITVDVMPKTNKSHLSRIKYIKKYIQTNQYDLIHANLFPAFYYTAIIKMLSKRTPKLVMTEHSTDNRRRHLFFMKPIEKIIYNQFDSIICISDGTYEKLIDWISPNSKKKKRYLVINNGVPIQDYSESIAYDREALWGFTEEDIILCMVGSFRAPKNHYLMLEVLKQLPKKYKLLLVGEGELKNEIEQLVVKELSLKDRVVFLGFRKDVSEIIHSSDIFVVPSKYEGFGLVAIEAMACGCPVVASDVAGLSSIVKGYGLLADPQNPESFVKQIRSLEDKSTYDYYSSSSLDRAKEFSIERMSNSYIELYKSLFNEG